jgi:hypothetical protein
MATFFNAGLVRNEALMLLSLLRAKKSIEVTKEM